MMTTNSLRGGADTLENTELGSGSAGDLVAGPVTGGKTAGATRRPFSYHHPAAFRSEKRRDESRRGRHECLRHVEARS